DSFNGAPSSPLGGPQPLVLANGNVAQYVLRQALVAGQHTLTATYSGDANWTSVNSGSLAVSVSEPDFSLTPGPANVTISTVSNSAATSAITVSPLNGFTGQIGLSCGSGMPAGGVCMFAPAQVTMETAAVASTLTI